MKLPVKIPEALALTDDLIEDEQMRSTKKRVMQSLRWNSVLGSISQVSTFIAGVLMAAGMAIVLPAFASNIGLGLSGAMAAIPAVGIAVLGGAAAVTAVAVGSNYIASRIWQSKQFDNYEIAAQSTARHLVKEIEDHNMCFTQQPARGDGKSWCDAMKARREAEQQANRSV